MSFGTSRCADTSGADGAATDVPWPKVQRRIAQLIAADKFYTQVEYDNLDDVDPIAIRERLADPAANAEIDNFLPAVERMVQQEVQKFRKILDPYKHLTMMVK